MVYERGCDVVGNIGNDFVAIFRWIECEGVLVSNVYVSLVFKCVFKFRNKPVIKFDGRDIRGVFSEFSC